MITAAKQCSNKNNKDHLVPVHGFITQCSPVWEDTDHRAAFGDQMVIFHFPIRTRLVFSEDMGSCRDEHTKKPGGPLCDLGPPFLQPARPRRLREPNQTGRNQEQLHTTYSPTERFACTETPTGSLRPGLKGDGVRRPGGVALGRS